MPVTVSQKGPVVIPDDLRKKYNLHPGAEVSVVERALAWPVIPRPTASTPLTGPAPTPVLRSGDGSTGTRS